MKGKVEGLQTKRNERSMKYEVGFLITVRKGLSYERSRKLLSQLSEKYLDKMVEIALSETN